MTKYDFTAFRTSQQAKSTLESRLGAVISLAAGGETAERLVLAWCLPRNRVVSTTIHIRE